MSGRGILIARQDNCGDVLLAGPAVRAAAATGRPVHLLCGPRGRPAAELLPGVTSIVETRVPWIEPEPMTVTADDGGALVAHLAALGVGDAAVLVSSHQSPLPLALLLRWAGVDRIAAVSHDHAGSLLDVRIPGDPDVHEVRRGLLVTESLGYPAPADDRLAVRRDLPSAPGPDGPYVVLHPGASAPARTLGPRRWRTVAAAAADAGHCVVVTGTRGEQALGAEVTGERADIADLTGRLTFPQLATLLSGAEAVVCGNTGPAHLAAAVGTPVVSVFPPTVPAARWRPWGVPHVVLGDQAVGCAGCRSRVCPMGDQWCVAGVSGPVIVEALARLGARPARMPKVAS